MLLLHFTSYNSYNIIYSLNIYFRQTVRCECGYPFCFRCGEESHDPSSCSQVLQQIYNIPKFFYPHNANRDIVKINIASKINNNLRQLSVWSEKCSNESETANWILANTKKCPKCHARIEKNQGCNHMNCKLCKYEFCWICMGMNVLKFIYFADEVENIFTYPSIMRCFPVQFIVLSIFKTKEVFSGFNFAITESCILY